MPRSASMRFSAIARSREIIFALGFLGMALYETFEIWMFELPGASPIWRKVLVHGLQVGLILGVPGC